MMINVLVYFTSTWVIQNTDLAKAKSQTVS